MSLLLFLLGALQAAADAARWVIHNGAWCAAATVALFGMWLAWKLPAEDPPPLITADTAPTPPARLAEDDITAALAAYDWDAAKADLNTDDPAEPNP